MDTSYPDAFPAITRVSINSNNKAGLLSSMAQAHMHTASVESGLKNMSWAELSGSTVSVADANLASDISKPASGSGGTGAYIVSNAGAVAATLGPCVHAFPAKRGRVEPSASRSALRSRADPPAGPFLLGPGPATRRCCPCMCPQPCGNVGLGLLTVGPFGLVP